MRAKYIGCSEDQAKISNCSDPRKALTIGTVYEVEREEVHSWHTQLYLKGIESKTGYNSVCFEY